MPRGLRTVVVIPARWGSTRFPGKPLEPVAGVPMVQRVWALARAAEGVSDVTIATDDARIADAASAFGADTMMTPEECRNGTERAHAAAEMMKEAPDVVINLQGDAVLTPPWVIGAVAGAFADPDVRIATPAVPLDEEQLAALQAHKTESPASGTTVVTDINSNALYFSKAIIPFRRTPGVPVLRHVGIYGYRRETLAGLVRLPEGALEKTEGLEQLRALENGIPIRVVPVDYQGRTHWSVDSPADQAAAETLIEREGELLSTYDGTGRYQA